MKCPVCNVELKMTDRQGVEIDYCPQCRGVWLDRGELDKIIERSYSASYDDDRRDDDERDDHHRYGSQHHGPQHRKRKSFLGEIFDFD
jgi:Zn-finger nucleic acid-binding protein